MQVHLSSYSLTLLATLVSMLAMSSSSEATSISSQAPTYRSILPHGHTRADVTAYLDVQPNEELPNYRQARARGHRIANPSHLLEYLSSLNLAVDPLSLETRVAPMRGPSLPSVDTIAASFPAPPYRQESNLSAERPSPVQPPRRVSSRDALSVEALRTNVNREAARQDLANVCRFVARLAPDEWMDSAPASPRSALSDLGLFSFLRSLQQDDVTLHRLTFGDLRRFKQLYTDFQDMHREQGPPLAIENLIGRPTAPARRTSIRRPRHQPGSAPSFDVGRLQSVSEETSEAASPENLILENNRAVNELHAVLSAFDRRIQRLQMQRPRTAESRTAVQELCAEKARLIENARDAGRILPASINVIKTAHANGRCKNINPAAFA